MDREGPAKGGNLTTDARLRRRHRAERRFRGLCIAALALAATFLVAFLGSMIAAARLYPRGGFRSITPIRIRPGSRSTAPFTTSSAAA